MSGKEHVLNADVHQGEVVELEAVLKQKGSSQEHASGEKKQVLTPSIKVVPGCGLPFVHSVLAPLCTTWAS